MKKLMIAWSILWFVAGACAILNGILHITDSEILTGCIWLGIGACHGVLGLGGLNRKN